MKKFFFAAIAALGLSATIGVTSCQKDTAVKGDIPVYGWYGWNEKDVPEDSLKQLFQEWQQHGLVGVCVNCGFDFEKIEKAAKIAHEVGLEYHAWAPSMLGGNDKDSTWYTVNRLGKSAFNPKERAYVEYYSTLDPHNPEVVKYLSDQYAKIAEIPEVDYVQLDYIRYADVVLSEGLWVKYDTIMGKKSPIGHDFGSLEIGPMEGSAKPASVNEFPGADYCYCDSCVADFKAKTDIDIRAKVAAGVDPASVPGWAQFRCDNVTNCVNAICKAVHEKGKKISADVFPGPHSYAEWMVRQQWQNWDVDCYFPMNYNDFYLKGADWVGTVTKEEVETVEGKKPIMSGLFICYDYKHKSGDIDPENSGLVPSEIAAAVKAAKEAGAAGICLFCPNQMTPEHWAEFDKAIGIVK